jgi:hypothetical protein
VTRTWTPQTLFSLSRDSPHCGESGLVLISITHVARSLDTRNDSHPGAFIGRVRNDIFVASF